MPRPARRAPPARSLTALAPFLVVALLLAGQAGAESSRAEHLVLVSIDGLRSDFYLEPSRPTPVLQRLAREGVRALAVRPVFPSVTYPAHTTLVTGVHPARHGIFYNAPFEPAGYSGRWYWEHEAIAVETLWQAVRRIGGTSAAVSWPVTVGAPIDFNLPEVWSLEATERFGARIREEASPSGLVERLEPRIGGLREVSASPDYFIRDLTIARAAIELLEERPTVLAVHLIGPDHFQHSVGREGFAVDRAIAVADVAVGLLLEAAQRLGLADRTAWVITGDHGFVDTHTSLAPNVWLAQAGIAVDRSGPWEAVFHGAGAAMFLHLRDPNDAATLERVRATLAALPASVRALFAVLDRDAIAALGGPTDTPLALSPVAGVRTSWHLEGPAIRPSSGGTHGYTPESAEIQTGFIGYGAGFRQGVVVPQMSSTDVYPLIAALLGFDPGSIDGVLLPGLLAAPPSRSESTEPAPAGATMEKGR